MSIRSRLEEEFEKSIKNKLSLRGNNYQRRWLDPSLYGKNLSFELIDSDPTQNARIIYPIHSYEIIEMEDPEIEILQDKICEKIENFFISKIFEYELESKISYAEGKLKVSLDYRIGIFELDYIIVLNKPLQSQ